MCFQCQQKTTFADRIGRKDECMHCHSDLHVCKNCEFYDRSSYNECRDSSAERVVEKEKSNFCDFFAPNGDQAKHQEGSAPKDLKAAAEALFKKN